MRHKANFKFYCLPGYVILIELPQLDEWFNTAGTISSTLIYHCFSSGNCVFSCVQWAPSAVSMIKKTTKTATNCITFCLILVSKCVNQWGTILSFRNSVSTSRFPDVGKYLKQPLYCKTNMASFIVKIFQVFYLLITNKIFVSSTFFSFLFFTW